jgi:uridine phosphorylase
MNELMISSTYPILEFDNTRKTILEPSEHILQGDVPAHAVICFFAEVIKKLVHDFDCKVIFTSRSEMGEHPVYEIKFQESRLAFFHPGIGAPLAVGLMEEVIALGVKNFIACGGCGVLDKTLSVGKLMLPTSAIRDEGTSYHYIPPSREIEMDHDVVDILRYVLQEHNLPFIKTKTWTTDAIYRETANKVELYKDEGCLAVEMESAAMVALARFRQVRFGQILYAGDSVMSEGWDGRAWHSRKEIRENLFWLAAEACLKL